jgi:DNA ligase-1
MQNCSDIIVELESKSSRIDKEKIIVREALLNNLELFDGFNLAYNALITFGVKKVPIHSGPDGQGLPWTVFKKLAEQLQNRELTGNAAKDAIELALTVATESEWNNWYRRILIKDLRCGVSETTINKQVEKINASFVIKKFSCQLAHDGANHEGKIKGKKIIESKLDGVRVLTLVWPNGKVQQFSRNGKELFNFEHVKKQFAAGAKYLDQPYVFDGEIMSKSFQDLMTQVHRKTSVEAGDAVLYLFDMLPLSAFEKGIYTVSQLERSATLKEWYEQQVFMQLLDNVRVVEQELVNLDSPSGRARFKEINQFAIDAGFEGIMLKDPDAPYELKRSVAWLKQKPVISVDLIIDSVEEGTGKNKGCLGAFVCRGIDNNRQISVNVGSGFTDLQRIEYWTNRDIIIGSTVEVLADVVTQNKDGTYSLRFPRFLRFRGFVPNEKI